MIDIGKNDSKMTNSERTNDDFETKYGDMLDLPHHTSPTRPHMSGHDRASQFSPFAALTGYEDCIREAARLTDAATALDEDEIALLDARLRVIAANIASNPRATVTYFVPDRSKPGGEYLTVTDNIVRIDDYEKTIQTSGGRVIPISEIYKIESELFSGTEDGYEQ